MRIKRTFRYLLLAAVLLLCACGQDEAPVNETQGSSESRESYGSESAGLSSEQNASEGADTPPAPGMVRSRLTNEWIREELADRRPIAVMIPNEYKATPHYALSEASVLYEAPVEGRMTRLMAVFEDWEPLEKIGNIRIIRELRFITYFPKNPADAFYGVKHEGPSSGMPASSMRDSPSS